MTSQLLLFSATCQFLVFYYGGSWHVTLETTAAVGMTVKIQNTLVVNALYDIYKLACR